MSGPKSSSSTIADSRHPIVSIVGPTATGKTSLAVWLAKKILQADLLNFSDSILKNSANSNLSKTTDPDLHSTTRATIDQVNIKGIALISADSRQVYRGLELLTGADIPNKFSRHKKSGRHPDYDFFLHSTFTISLHGTSIIYPNQEWSVTHFRDLAIRIIEICWQRNWLPILVGGTGLYHQHVFNNDPNLYVPPNKKIRQKANHMPVEKLQNWLKKVNTQAYKSMNQSDRNNPRRLIRAIEIAAARSQPSTALKKRLNNRPKLSNNYQRINLGLKAPLDKLERRIKQRVKQRFALGAVKEVEQLLDLNLSPDSPILSATGVKPIQQYLANQQTAVETVDAWTLEEKQYAKRQLTWWNKIENIEWLSITNNQSSVPSELVAHSNTGSNKPSTNDDTDLYHQALQQIVSQINR